MSQSPSDTLRGENFIWRVAETSEEATRFPLPPSVVAKVDNEYHAIFLLLDAPPESKEYNAGSNYRVLHWRPDLKYHYADYQAACQVEEEITLRILTRMMQPGPMRTQRELAVIVALHQVGMSEEAIELIFKEMPIGDPYRNMGSLIGSLTMLDELVRDVYNNWQKSKFASYRDVGELWFHLPSALRWWYKERRKKGLRVLPKREMVELLKLQMRTVDEYYIMPLATKVCGGTQWKMWGIDLERARELGVIEEKKDANTNN